MKVKKKKVQAGMIGNGNSFSWSGEFYTVMNVEQGKDNAEIRCYGHAWDRPASIPAHYKVRPVNLEVREV